MGEIMDSFLILLFLIQIMIAIIGIYIDKINKKLEKLKEKEKNLENTVSEVSIIDNVEILNDEKYYYYVLNALSNAKKEVNMIMFSIYKCKKTEELIKELINCRKRGVMVRLILDGEVESNKMINNHLSIERIPIKLSKNIRIHNKLIIIDNKITILGSHNWTDKALFENKESSIAIIDEEVSKKEKEYFDILWSKL